MQNKIIPISPDQIVPQKVKVIPEFVIDAFNKLIAKNYSVTLGESFVKQEEVIYEILKNSSIKR